MLSFIVPAHNEESLIGRTIESLHGAARGVEREYEIVVADDSSTDRTGRIAAQRGARVVRIDRRQIAAARNAGARAATRTGCDDALVFVDADTVVPAATLRAALAALSRGAVGGGAAVCFDGEVPRWANVALNITLLAFRALRWAAGCFVFCTREAFDAAGGWDESVFASEEILFSRALGTLGRFVVLREHVVTSGRKVRCYSAREIVATMLRIGLAGRGGVSDRSRLDIWYARRRVDPHAPGAQVAGADR